jgi:hypothetical protein
MIVDQVLMMMSNAPGHMSELQTCATRLGDWLCTHPLKDVERHCRPSKEPFLLRIQVHTALTAAN